MSEKRKPYLKLIAVKYGKRMRLEVFEGRLFDLSPDYRGRTKFRVRVNGKWAEGYWTLSQIFNQMRSYAAKLRQPTSPTDDRSGSTSPARNPDAVH